MCVGLLRHCGSYVLFLLFQVISMLFNEWSLSSSLREVDPVHRLVQFRMAARGTSDLFLEFSKTILSPQQFFLFISRTKLFRQMQIARSSGGEISISDFKSSTEGSAQVSRFGLFLSFTKMFSHQYHVFPLSFSFVIH